MNAEDLIKLSACAVHLRQIEVVNYNGQRKVAEVIPVQLDLLDAFTQFSDLGFFRIVEKRVLRSRIVHTDLAVERTLSVVEMAALGLDSPARRPGIFFLPLRHDVIVGFDFEQAFKDERKALGRRLLER